MAHLPLMQGAHAGLIFVFPLKSPKERYYFRNFGPKVLFVILETFSFKESTFS